jgi:hypothetical protein
MFSTKASIHLAKRLHWIIFVFQIEQSETGIACGACLLTDWDEMCNLYRGLSMDASYQVSYYLTKWLQKRRFLEIDQSEASITYGGHVCKANRDNMSKFHRGPGIDASYEVSIHLAKRFQRRILRNQPIRKRNCLWRPRLLPEQDAM